MCELRPEEAVSKTNETQTYGVVCFKRQAQRYVVDHEDEIGDLPVWHPRRPMSCFVFGICGKVMCAW